MNGFQLYSLATVSVGVPRIEGDGFESLVGFLQTSDVDSFGRLLPDAPRSTTALLDSQLERAWVQPGDVLLANKGARYVAVFYSDAYPRVVASGSFYILRVLDSMTLLPEFLACYLNLRATQYQLQVRIGNPSTVSTLNKKDLLDLFVTVPPLEIQRALVELNNSFIDIYDKTQQQLNLQQALLNQCFSTTLQIHR
ncbi:restriction endonuclease subunit S [Spirosoma telluris]|uniref:restriction endonuclease subunit S n=1 Tax=Spirosoma telluris TaxID=2183553 RepID=UPI0012FC0861